MTRILDLNCDLGESFGAWRLGDDAGVLPHVSSANIACGFHAGDPQTMRATVALALAHGVALGAQPGWPDLVGFGRRALAATPAETHALVLYQIGALAAFAHAAGARLAHVKPHGALYNQAARDRALANAVAQAVRDFDPSLILFGLAGSALIEAGLALGLTVAREAFADRRYQADGSLTPRSQSGALIDDIGAAVAQALLIATRGEAIAIDGTGIAIAADTLCVHGDRPDAAEFARRLRQALDAANVHVTSPGHPEQAR